MLGALAGLLLAAELRGAHRFGDPDRERAAPGEEPEPWSISPYRLRDLDRRQAVAVALLVVVLVLTGVQVIRNLSGQRAVVVGDEALIALEAHDVVEVVPTTGKVTSAVLYGNLALPKNPGPAESWTLAPFVWLLGTSLGCWVYAYVLNMACALLAAWAGFRRGGPRLGLVVLTVCLVMFAVAAPGGISSVLNTRIVLMPLFATLVLAALVALGDSVLLPVLVVVSSFVIQTHIGYAPVAATALLTAVAIVAWHRLRRPRPPHLGRHLLTALAVGVACWALPLHDQLFGSGNLHSLLRARVPRSGPERALDAVGTILNPGVIFFQRGELSSTSYAWPSSSAALLLLAVAAWALWRHRVRLAARKELLVLAGLCVLAAGVTAALTPPNDTAGEHFYWIRAVAFFLLLVVVLACTEWRDRPTEPSRVGVWIWSGVWCAVLFLAVAPFWAAEDHTDTEERAMAAVHDLLPTVEAAAAGEQPVAIAHQGYWPAIAVADGLITEATNRSIPVVQVNDTTSLPDHTTLVVTQGPPRLGDPVASSPAARDGIRRMDLHLVPQAVAKWAQAHPPLELVGPGALSLGDVLDGTARSLCIDDHRRDPASLLDLDPTVVADLYFQQQVRDPTLPEALTESVARWAGTWPTELYVAPPSPPGEVPDDLLLSSSSCP